MPATRFATVAAMILSTTLFWPGCESKDSASSSSDSDADSDSDTDSDSDSDSDSDADSDSDSDTDTDSSTDFPVCDEQNFEIALVPGKLMILQDLSSSMDDADKWEQAVAALTAVLEGPEYVSVQFGFDVFPDGSATSGCGVNAPVQQDCTPDSTDDVLSLLTSIAPSSGGSLTPLYCAMYNFTISTYAPGLVGGDEPGFLLVVSDGQPTCTKLECEDSWDNVFPADMGAITAELAALGIKTFVIGFDYATADDPAFLDQIAANGDTGYDVIMVDDEEGLTEALEDVAGTVVSCTYEVAEPDDSVDPDLVNFFFEYGDEEQVVPYDEGCADGSGWMWGNPEHTLVVFCDEACAELGGGEVTGVTVEWGCETVEVE